MKGDFSRFTFDPRSHYTRLPLQQGRVLYDGDWNEQADISLYDRRISGRAIIGPSGGPLERAALRLEIVGGKPWLGVGGVSAEVFDANLAYAKPAWYWVEGCTLTQERAWAIAAQPHLSDPLPTALGYYLAWVDTFERLLTALDAPEIREVALGGPDHGTRVQQIWQVRLRAFPWTSTDDPDCFDLPNNWRPVAPTGQMHARVADPVTSEDPCVVPRTSGYRRLENQLYRIEIRDGGDEGTAKFVWSRDNGIVRVRAIEGSYPSSGAPSIQVAELGRDELTRLTTGDWVEITDDTRTLAGMPGYMCQISSISSTTLELRAASALTKAQFDALKAPSVRRWDMVDESKHVAAAYLGGAVYPVSAALDADYFDLEDGVQVRFTPGSFRSGDYWLVPARTTSGDVEFAATSQLPHGVPHHAAALGILHCDGGGAWRLVRDCRNLFPPITRLSQLHYVGGDGQEIKPGGLLPAALEVAVTNGTVPVEGVDIVFSVGVPNGTNDTELERGKLGHLLSTDPIPSGPNVVDGSLTRTVKTNERGIAGVRWALGTVDARSSAGWSQRVGARVDRHGPGDPTGEIHFHANQSIAREVQVDITACPNNEEDPLLKTVQELMADLGINPDNASHQNVQHVLHQLLCRLNARHVPYVFRAPLKIEPASVTEVKSALDALYWLVLQREGCCCLTDVIKKLAELVGSQEGRALCDALKRGPLEGECSLLEITLGAALNLVRVVYAVVLSFLDLQDAPGPQRGYDGLKLGNETGIALDAFIQGEGPGWFATRVEERVEQVEALGDQVLDLVFLTLEKVLEERRIDRAVQELANRYGQPGRAWNGPATRYFILNEIYEPLFGTRRLDDAALIRLRELLLDITQRLWREFVELLLCGEPVAARIPPATWLRKIDSELGEALDRAFSLHGLVRELPEEEWGTPQDVHMVAPSPAYPAGATWVVSSSAAGQTFLLRWRHDDDDGGPLRALDDAQLQANRLLSEPDLVIGVAPRPPIGLRVLDSGARRQSLHLLAELSEVENQKTTLLWWLPSVEVSRLEGNVEEPFAEGNPRFGKTFAHRAMPVGRTVLIAGGPDDPPSLVGWTTGEQAGPHVWAPTVQRAPFALAIQELFAIGLPRDPPTSLHAFALDDVDGPRPGRYVALAVMRQDSRQGLMRQRNLLVLLEGRAAEGQPIVPWWEASRMAPSSCWDLPAGVRVVGGAHNLVALQDDGIGETPEDGENTGPRWMLVSVAELLAFPFVEIGWDNQPASRVLVEIPAERWREGHIDSVVHGNDGPWIQALGPLSGRLGLYRAWTETTPPLQRQMVRGAAVEDAALSQATEFFTNEESDDVDDDQVVEAEVRIEHDYQLASTPIPRLLTVCISSGDGTPLIEFNASPRS